MWCDGRDTRSQPGAAASKHVHLSEHLPGERGREEAVHTSGLPWPCSLCSHFPKPHWFRKSGVRLLTASRKSYYQCRRKTGGNISDSLRCSPWRRAENPEKMKHSLHGGGNHSNGYVCLVHPDFLASRHPGLLAQHRVWLSWAKRFATSFTTSIPIGLHALVCRFPMDSTIR